MSMISQEPWIDRGIEDHRFRVLFQKQNGEVHEEEIDAHDVASAAWNVARNTFDCISPGTWQLLDVTTLR
jgi:hypothetical protein